MDKPYTERRFTGTPDEVNAKWVESRKQGIGGSDVASLMGLNRYGSPYEVWMQKTGRMPAPDLGDVQAVEWGNRLEDVVRRKFAEQHPELDVHEMDCTLVSKERPWAFANLDGMLTDQRGSHGILEVKTASAYRAGDWDDGPPTYYLTQVAHYMSVTGFTWAWFAVLLGGNEYREFFVQRDEEDVRTVSSYVDTFWHENVEADVPPMLVGTPGETKALLSCCPQESDEYADAYGQTILNVLELVGVNQQIKDLTEHKRHLENDIRAAIGSNKGITTPTKKVTWVRTTAKRFDAKRFKDENPELAAQYTTASVRDGGLRITDIK